MRSNPHAIDQLSSACGIYAQLSVATGWLGRRFNGTVKPSRSRAQGDTFTVNARVRIPPQQAVAFNPGGFEVAKFGWIQARTANPGLLPLARSTRCVKGAARPLICLRGGSTRQSQGCRLRSVCCTSAVPRYHGHLRACDLLGGLGVLPLPRVSHARRTRSTAQDAPLLAVGSTEQPIVCAWIRGSKGEVGRRPCAADESPSRNSSQAVQGSSRCLCALRATRSCNGKSHDPVRSLEGGTL